MNSPLWIYENGLRHGAMHMLTPGGARTPLPLARWIGAHDLSDESMLGRCHGPTLDVGCGPGRLTAALTDRGVVTLGIDISRVAVAMTRMRGAIALRRDVFDALPGHGRWDHLLLADGNIGIGGDPVALLRRCRTLLAPSGTLLLDLEPPGAGLLIEHVRLEHSGQLSDPFRWCWLGVDAVPAVAAPAGLRARAVWSAECRWQAELEVTDNHRQP
jgi:SAM-dependent methyltransferase